MNTRLHFENLTHLIFAFLTLLFLLFSYGFYLESSVEESIGECGVVDESPVSKHKDNGAFQLGMTLFKNNCASCHAKNMRAKLTGPPLEGVLERWDNKENLYAWIRNSQAFLATGDKYANALFLEYNQSVMTAYPNLSDEDIEAILDYIEIQSSH